MGTCFKRNEFFFIETYWTCWHHLMFNFILYDKMMPTCPAGTGDGVQHDFSGLLKEKINIGTQGNRMGTFSHF